MTHLRLPRILVVAALLLGATRVTGEPVTVSDGVLGTVRLYRPGRANGVVIMLSGETGWSRQADAAAERLQTRGALVAGIELPRFIAGMSAAGGCAYPPGPLEQFAKRLELQQGLTAYLRPALAGVGEGASLAYAALAMAPPGAFSGGVGIALRRTLTMRQPLCQIRATAAPPANRGARITLPVVALPTPWIDLPGTEPERLPLIDEAWDRLTLHARETPPSAATGSDVVGLREIEATSSDKPGNAFVVFLSGDGGWAELDQTVAARLAASGLPVVGWSSLDYYWKKRTPEEAARDLGRIIDTYAARWRRPRVKIVGYSFGADVAPFLVNRLPPSARERVTSVALLGPSHSATFEFHLTDWIHSRANAAYPLAPALASLRLPLLCVYPGDDADSVCGVAALESRRAVGRGHHFSEQYGRLAELVLAAP